MGQYLPPARRGGLAALLIASLSACERSQSVIQAEAFAKLRSQVEALYSGAKPYPWGQEAQAKVSEYLDAVAANRATTSGQEAKIIYAFVSGSTGEQTIRINLLGRRIVPKDILLEDSTGRLMARRAVDAHGELGRFAMDVVAQLVEVEVDIRSETTRRSATGGSEHYNRLKVEPDALNHAFIRIIAADGMTMQPVKVWLYAQ